MVKEGRGKGLATGDIATVRFTGTVAETGQVRAARSESFVGSALHRYPVSCPHHIVPLYHTYYMVRSPCVSYVRVMHALHTLGELYSANRPHTSCSSLPCTSFLHLYSVCFAFFLHFHTLFTSGTTCLFHVLRILRVLQSNSHVIAFVLCDITPTCTTVAHWADSSLASTYANLRASRPPLIVETLILDSAQALAWRLVWSDISLVSRVPGDLACGW